MVIIEEARNRLMNISQNKLEQTGTAVRACFEKRKIVSDGSLFRKRKVHKMSNSLENRGK